MKINAHCAAIQLLNLIIDKSVYNSPFAFVIFSKVKSMVACLCHFVLSSFRLALWRGAKTK